MRFFIPCTLTILALLAILALPEPSFAADEFPLDDAQLVSLYAPILYFHPAELFRPQTVDVIVNSARLRQSRQNRLNLTILPNVTLSDLFSFKDSSYNLDVWLGDEGASDFMNYSAHRAYYQSVLSPEAGGPPVVTYAHITRDENPHHITIQYWLFYYYNDWFNKHEGDWELVEVILSENREPEWVVLGQHHGGTRRSWKTTNIELGTHPAVFVALGSHANYFWGDEVYPNGRTFGSVRVEIMDRTGNFGRIIPEVILIPDRKEVEFDPDTWDGFKWISFGGHWGEAAPQSDFSGPLGPLDKGIQWEQPYAWGMAQPLDQETWYKNRLSVQVSGGAEENIQITLKTADGEIIPSVESTGNNALMHADPKPNEEIFVDIKLDLNTLYDIKATWPNPEASEVIHYTFTNVRPGPSGHALLIFQPENVPVLLPDGSSQKQIPSTISREPATWDAPDLVWVAGILPVQDVIKGIVISLIAGWLPALIYVVVLYNADRYEKEPKSLLAAAFVWGSIPAIIVAIAVRVFFQLPVDLLGPQAIEAVRAGLVSPLIEEALKGLAIVFIALRYRLEFDDVLDGIIYGAMVGFGFAMTGNTLSYLGAFLLRGFAGLDNTIFIEGIFYGLNHGLYSAIFGAGLGYARLKHDKWLRLAIPLAAFWLAVISHAVHNLALRAALGPSLVSIAVTWLGLIAIIAIIAWALRKQKQWIETELLGEVPEDIYEILTSWSSRKRAEWRALRERGLLGLRDERRILKICAELAIKKFQYRKLPEEKGLLEEVVRYRKRLQSLLQSRSA